MPLRAPGQTMESDITTVTKHALACVRVSGNSEGVKDPFDLSIVSILFQIDSQQDLLQKDRTQDLGSVVVQTAMPGPVIQVKQQFEPRIEWLDGGAALSVQGLSAFGFHELSPEPAMFLSANT